MPLPFLSLSREAEQETAPENEVFKLFTKIGIKTSAMWKQFHTIQKSSNFKIIFNPKIQPVIKRINGLICMVVHGKTVLVNASR